MVKRRFSLLASVSTENPTAVKRALQEFATKGSITRAEGGLIVKAVCIGPSARELNRDLLSAMRRIERKTRLRPEWTSGGMTERFFDYVPKGTRQA